MGRKKLALFFGLIWAAALAVCFFAPQIAELIRAWKIFTAPMVTSDDITFVSIYGQLYVQGSLSLMESNLAALNFAPLQSPIMETYWDPQYISNICIGIRMIAVTLAVLLSFGLARLKTMKKHIP